MDNNELKIIREALGFSVDAAARLIGKVDPRSWRRWERGDSPIPKDVMEVLESLIEWREELSYQISLAIEEVQNELGEAEGLDLVFYTSEETFVNKSEYTQRIYYYPYKTVIGEQFLISYPRCKLVVWS